MSKSYTAPRVSWHDNFQRTVPIINHNGIYAAAISLLKLFHLHIRHPPGCWTADWSGAGFQHLPCPPFLIWLAQPSSFTSLSGHPCPTLTHPPTGVVLPVRRLDRLLPTTRQKEYHSHFILGRNCNLQLYPLPLIADWSGVFGENHVPASVLTCPYILSHLEGSVPGRRLVRFTLPGTKDTIWPCSHDSKPRRTGTKLTQKFTSRTSLMHWNCTKTLPQNMGWMIQRMRGGGLETPTRKMVRLIDMTMTSSYQKAKRYHLAPNGESCIDGLSVRPMNFMSMTRSTLSLTIET